MFTDLLFISTLSDNFITLSYFHLKRYRYPVRAWREDMLISLEALALKLSDILSCLFSLKGNSRGWVRGNGE